VDAVADQLVHQVGRVDVLPWAVAGEEPETALIGRDIAWATVLGVLVEHVFTQPGQEAVC
jgi:hypothetical protein